MSLHKHACCVCGNESVLQEGVRIGNSILSICSCPVHAEEVQVLMACVRIGIGVNGLYEREHRQRKVADQLRLAADRNLRIIRE